MLKRLKSFLKNTSGSILPTMGILIVPLTMAAGVAIDYTRFVNMRSDIQTSLDAAGLATSAYLSTIEIPSGITTSEAVAAYKQAQGQVYATEFFLANVDDNISPSDYTLDVTVTRTPTGEETVSIKSSITYDSVFGQVHRRESDNFYTDIITDDLESIITLGNRTIEVALVMDNSGSMGGVPSGGSQKKVDAMKEATLKLVEDLYQSAAGSTLPDPVQFSLVPFAGAVNVGPIGHSNLAGKFIDTRGFNPANNENLDWDDTYETTEEIKTPGNRHTVKIGGEWKSRLDVFDMLGEPWAGCVEMRPWPHNVLDTYVKDQGGYNKVNNKLDGDGDGTNDGAKALFVPFFAPDEPDNVYAHSPGDYYYDDDGYRNSYLYDFEDADGNQLYTNHSSSDPAYQVQGSTRQIERTNWMFKYQNNDQHSSLNNYYGPNDGCTTDPITALTPDKATVDAAINAMDATGTTNIQQGLTWGWRTLSEGLPFDQGRPTTDRVNLKFIILLTDGKNFYSTDGDSTPNESAYGAWGYTRPQTHSLKHAIKETVSYHNRMSEGMDAADLAGTIYAGQSFDLTPTSGNDFNKLMNVHTAQACENVKEDGVSIYTIVYDLNDQPTEDLMEACAGSGRIGDTEVIAGVQFFHEADGANLDDTFEEIASSISAIRITQ